MKKRHLFALFVFLFAIEAWGSENPTYPPLTFDDTNMAPLFPFNIKNGFPDNITNIHSWNQIDPAGTQGAIKARGNHFVNDEGTVRFLGTNFCFSASFPDKKDAPSVAQSLARFGINLVRLHHMDAMDIWGKNLKKSTTVIDPEKLDRLDYLISEFKKNGIYVNINLHVSRSFRSKDGFVNTDKLPRLNKGIDNLDRKMIELQKKYAKDLLTHVNPYTGNAYINEPAVAMIEINNENSIISSWRGSSLDTLPPPYSTYLTQRWNDWLRKKYGSIDKLLATWRDECGIKPLGKDLAEEGQFRSIENQKWPRYWSMQTDNLSKTRYQFLPSTDQRFSGANILRLEITKMGKASWIPQIHRTNIHFEKDKIYTLSFWVRSETIKTIRTSAGMHNKPWKNLGLYATVPVTPEWTKHEYAFRATDHDDNARFVFSGFEPGVIEFAKVSLKEGCDIPISNTDDRLKETIPFPIRSNLSTFYRLVPLALNDWTEFLIETENGYFQEMYEYIKKDLKAQPPVSGTQFTYGARYAQARLDYADIHSYWKHPKFPNKRWDPNDWWLGDGAHVNAIGGERANIPILAMSRAIDRPYTVSEYDHPFPNFYSAEGYPMLASMAAFQDWSGLMQFAWTHTSDHESNSIPRFFDMRSNPVKRLHLPVCYAMFVRKDIQTGPGQYRFTPEFTTKDDFAEMTGKMKNGKAPIVHDINKALAVYTGLAFTDLDKQVTFSKEIKNIKDWKDLPDYIGNPDQHWVQNEFKELYWSFPKPNESFFKVDTPRSKLFTGFVNDQIFKFKGLTLRIGKTRLNWATVSLVQCKAKGPKTADKDRLGKGSWLLAANGYVCNSGQITTAPQKGTVSSAKAYGGNIGAGPALAEGVPMSILLAGIDPASVKVFALDEMGNRKENVNVSGSIEGANFEPGPRYKTLWYEIEIR